MTFIWDSKKNKANINKHGISFDEAKTVFYDDNARLIFDPDHSQIEERFILLGLSNLMKILVVCHYYREDNKVIRIISAREATKKEKNQYWEFLK